jgi:NitT/TauT family transport system permease protein
MNPLSRRARIAAAVCRLLLLVAFFSLWELAAARKWVDPLMTGQPSGIARYLWQELFVTGSLVKELGWTLLSVLGAFVIASVLGLLFGMVFVANRFLDEMLNPIFTALNAMPRIALAPLFLLWFGLGIASKIAIGASLTFFIVFYSTLAGGRSVSQDHITLARTLGASGTQIFRAFTFPSAVPVIFNGLKLGLMFSLFGVVGGELLASEHGLGQVLAVLAAAFNTDGVFATIFLLSIVGVACTAVMNAVENHLLRWR